MASSEGGVGIDLASAAAGESGTRGKFFRKALKGAVEGRYEDTKAEDRVSACQSRKFEIETAPARCRHEGDAHATKGA